MLSGVGVMVTVSVGRSGGAGGIAGLPIGVFAA